MNRMKKIEYMEDANDAIAMILTNMEFALSNEYNRTLTTEESDKVYDLLQTILGDGLNYKRHM